MKRILSMMLVAMLLVGCLSTVAFAAETKSGSCTFTVTGNFANFSGTVNKTAGMVITSITSADGVVGNPSTGVVGYAAGSNADRTIKFTVHYEVPAGATCGTYSVSASISAKKAIYKEDGVTPNGTEATKSSVSGGGSITVDHEWGSWSVTTPATCHSDGVETRVCAIDASHTETRPITERPAHNWGDWTVTTPAECGVEGEETRECKNDGCTEKETRPVAALKPERDESLPNNGWLSDANGHWYICGTCGEKHGSAAHDNKYVDNGNGTHKVVCKVCNYETDADEECKLSGWKQNGKKGHYKVCELCGHKTETKSHNFKNGKCTDCGYKQPTTNLPVPDMGDTTPYGTYNAIVFVIAMIAVFSVYALVSKRKSVK